MPSKQELLDLLKDQEAHNVERTVSTTDTKKFCQAICAFANDLPGSKKNGYLLIGVKDDGSLAGLSIGDEFLRDLGSIRSDGNILPMPSMNVEKHSLPGGDVAVVEVIPSDLPPVRYKGTVWIRVGPRRAVANESEERILSEKRVSSNKSFDTTHCPDSGLDELQRDLFTVTYRPNAVNAEIIRENHRSIEEQMASLRFFDVKKNCATHAGLILFGIDPLRWLPGAYIQFTRFEGTTMAGEPLQDKIFSGDLLTLLRDLDAFLSIQVRSRPVQETMLKEREHIDYPNEALREFLMNAVMHRSYESNSPIRFYWFDDRIEIQNPGGLYGDATPENFPRQNSYRNPVIAEAMKVLGYVNKYGRGVYRAQESLKKNGNPEAKFKFETTYFLVTIEAKS